MPLIQTINLKKIYKIGKDIFTQALDDINITIEPKDFTVIAGPSGSGKSSLLHLLGALDSPNEGAILYEGHDITKIPVQRLAEFRLQIIGFVFQAYNLITTLTALENVEYIMLLQGIPPDQRRERAVNILKRVGLESYIHRFPNEMSGGQQQRVAVARAIVAEPKVVFADEPTANLDSKTAENLIDLMRELNEEKSITFVFSTHDKMIMDKAKRIITLKDGKVIS